MAGIQPLDLGQAALMPMELAQRMDQSRARFPAELAHTEAMTRLGQAQAGEAEMRMQKSKDFLRLSQGWSPNPKASPSDNLLNLGSLAIGAGDLVGAEKLYAMAAQASLRQTQAENQQALIAQRQAALAGAHQKALTSSYATVTNSADPSQIFMARLMYLNQMQGIPGAEERANEVEQILLTGGKDAISQLHRAAVGEKEVARETASDRLAALQLQKFQQRIRMDEFGKQIRQANLSLRAQRSERTEKAGGKDVATPSDRQVVAAKAQLGLMGVAEALGNTEEFSTFAREIASQANLLRRDSGFALSEAESITRAYKDIIGSGAVTPKEKTFLGFSAGKRESYDPKKVARPLEVPKGIPPGSKFEGKYTENGRKAWRAPDGQIWEE